MSDHLVAIDQQIADLMAKKKAMVDSTRKEELKKVKAAIALYGYSLSELGLAERKKRGEATAKPKKTRTKIKTKVKKAKAAPKYSNPANSSDTWAGGRGAKPKWVKEHLAKGGQLDDLLIK